MNIYCLLVIDINKNKNNNFNECLLDNCFGKITIFEARYLHPRGIATQTLLCYTYLIATFLKFEYTDIATEPKSGISSNGKASV